MFEKKIPTFLICLIMLCFSATATMGADILFISSMEFTRATGDEHMVGDEAIKAFLESLGHTVTFFDDDEDEAATEVAAAGADVVFISETVSSGKIREEITEVETLMVITEAWAWDEMGLTEGGGSGVDVATTDIEIVAPGHFLAAGLSGTAPVLTDITGPVSGTARFSMGVAGPEATVIARATLSDGLTYDVVFVYEKGAALAQPPADGSPQVAADIRICLGFDYRSYPLWNDNAYALLEAAVNYALGIVGPPSQARNQRPRNATTDVPQEAVLTWTPGAFADKHDVYFGTVFEDVNDADRTNPLSVLVSQDQTAQSYDPDGLLEFGQTYHWRIDEINDVDPNSPWKGGVQSFATIDHFVVDGFEDYNDYPPYEIYSTWADGYQDSTNGSQVGNLAPPIAETTIIHGGKQAMPFFYDNSAANHSEGVRAFSPVADWTREGVNELSLWFKGNPAYVGSFTEAPVGTYTMTASGADIWNNSDEFHFAYREATGAVTIVAKVESVENTHEFAKAGVMIRDTLDADSANVSLLITPENGVRFQFRANTGGSTDRFFVEGIVAPQWVKLERTVGGLVRAYYSADGSAWTQLELTTVSMSTPTYIGLALTSHDTALTCEANFSNVSFPDTNTDLQWAGHQDIGMISNEAEPMYVAVSNANGTAGTVFHDDPDAALINAWTQWSINLSDFADQGVDLAGVDAISIGLGDGSSGGAGTMFFDDVRLYLRPVVESEAVAVENASFELPGTDKQKGFENVAGWSTDGPCADSGVETGYTATDGDWTAYLMSGDPSVWQSTGHTISEGQVLELKVDARITWAATGMQMIIYYDDGGVRIPVATSDVALTDAMQEYTLSFSGSDVPESVGKNVGVEFSNSSSGDTWIGLDNVRVEASSE